jgi:outer membrane murein-binding lipoprotein Lpp
MHRALIAVAAVSIMALAGSACATKKFVKGEVDTVNGKVETLSQSIEATPQGASRRSTRRPTRQTLPR